MTEKEFKELKERQLKQGEAASGCLVLVLAIALIVFAAGLLTA